MTRVIFDAGLVLFYPKSGEWFLPKCYFDYCNENDLEAKPESIRKNFNDAYSFLLEKNYVKSIHEEELLFRRFYSHLLKEINKPDRDDLISKCVWGKVYDPEKYLMYDDVKQALEEINKGYKRAVISDAWPSLVRVFEYNKIKEYFDNIIISTEVGYSKEDDEIFKIALNKCNNRPEECIFIDDSLKNCVRATNLGIESIILDRSNKVKYNPDNIIKFKTLMEVVSYIRNRPTSAST